jgi:hypothetical protein
MRFAVLAILSICLTSIYCQKQTTVDILMVESTICGRCQAFISRDLKDVISRKDYQNLLNITILPTAHLREQKINGTYNYTHSFGDEYLVKAKIQICVNNLYSNDKALRWAVYYLTQRKWNTTEAAVRDFFNEDNGNAVLSCAKGPQGNVFTRAAYLIYMNNWYSGMLPSIIYKKTLINPFQEPFIKTLCNLVQNRTLYAACDEVKETQDELGFLSTEYDTRPVQAEAVETDFNFEKFWATEDD